MIQEWAGGHFLGVLDVKNKGAFWRVYGVKNSKIYRKYLQDTNQFIGYHVGWIGIYIIHNTIQAS